ncbi:hypothetical protein [Fundidesulfovibrio soli]|uniref:hypothetical protein n=1 Tax=Fundidesulfovibrio soli TaxID=2922716 RepID=UPI001FB022C9|nr:hypothetical protein [Fundidesulfovibrio soli]
MGPIIHNIFAWLCSHKANFFVGIATIITIVLVGTKFYQLFNIHFKWMKWVDFGMLFLPTLVLIGQIDFSKVLAGRQNLPGFLIIMMLWGIFINPADECFLWSHYILDKIGIHTITGGKLQLESFRTSMIYSIWGIPGTLIYAAVFGVAIALLNRSVVWYLRRKDRAAGRA